MTTDSKAVCGGGEIDPGRALKDALFCCLKAGGEPRAYGGVLADGGKKAWVRFTLETPEASAALASTAGAGAGDWQPIETAPKDGTRILVIRQTEGGNRFVEVSAWRRDTYDRYHWSLNGDYQRSWHPAVAWQPMPAVEVQSPAVPASPRSGAGEKVDQALLRELSDLADWLERDSSENDVDNVRAAVSALSQEGGAGRSEKGEGDSIERVRSSHAELIADGLARQDPAPHAAPPATGTWKTLTVSACPKNTAPCHWGGGNDIIWCSTCGAQYAYAKGEERPPCPRSAAPAQSPSTSDAEG